MNNMNDFSWLSGLKTPSREYSPIPFWFLNGNLTRREIRRQLQDFRDHGVFGVVLHPRMGLSRRIQYLSPVFFRYLRTAVETAAELEMTVVLYDEGMYPSGSAGGLVTEGHPELASRGLSLVQSPSPQDRVLWQGEPGFLVERFSGGTIRGLHYGEDDGQPYAPKSADILNPKAVNRFIALTHEAYAREFQPYFGTTILGIFTDEPSILGRNTRDLQPWTEGFADLFQSAGGHLSGLVGLFTGEETADTALYRRMILEREAEVYYAPLSAWCEAHGLALMGHPHQSDDIEVQRYFHIPGQDLVFRWVAPETGGIAGMDSTMAKCSADAARLMNRKRNSNECFGACNREGNPWHFTGSDMKWFIDYLAVRGVNLFIPHAFYYSLSGRRSAERPPDVGPGNIWWPHYRQWSAYMARLSCLMAETEAVISLAVPCRNRELHADEVAPLFRSQRSFQYLPESVWPECREESGNLICRDRRYLAVLADQACFPSVSHDPESVPPDCQCNPPQPELRCARLKHGTRDLWFLTNEGKNRLETRLALPVQARIGAFDLWAGEMRKMETESTEQGTCLNLCLEPFESLLLFACETQEEWESLPLPEPAPKQVLTNRDFTLVSEEPMAVRKTYAAKVPAGNRPLAVRVDAEEMAELYANGKFVGAAFWAPQVFRIPAALRGNAPLSLTLVVTGSLANRYGRPVPYGLAVALRTERR